MFSIAVSSILLLSDLLAGTVQAQSQFSGRVYAEPNMQVLSDVEVTIAELAKLARTNDRGNFTLVGISPGTYTVVARRIGYARFESRITFGADEKIERAIVLPPVAPLDTMKVVGDYDLPLSFIENKGAGLGHFLTRADLESRDGQRLSNILAQFPGVGIVRGRGSQSWILSKRYVLPISTSRKSAPPSVYIPTDYEKNSGMIVGCYARVYLDGVLLNGGPTADPVDVNEYLVKGIEAIEYYDGAAQTPSRYARLNSNCGVLVIHTRRR